MNSVTFKKKKFLLFNGGSGFNVEIYDNENNLLDEVVINSESIIVYKWHSYSAYENLLDYEYILELYKEKYDGYKQ